MIAIAAVLAILSPQTGGPLIPITGPVLTEAPDAAGIDARDCARDSAAGECATDPHARFRVAPQPPGPDAKARALAVDGTECNLVGDRRCTSKGIPIFRSQR